MLAFLAENLATILIGLAILALVVLIAVKLIRDKKKGKVEIEYYSEAELERIVELIESIRQ